MSGNVLELQDLVLELRETGISALVVGRPEIVVTIVIIIIVVVASSSLRRTAAATVT